MNAMERLIEADAIARLVDRDPTLFSSDVDLRQPIMQRLGWTDLAEKASSRLPLVTNIAMGLSDEGVTDVVLLGMGGSSLAALVMNEVLGPVPGSPRLHVLDTTSPTSATTLMATLHPSRTAFVVASKSGTTVEPLSLYSVFREWMDDSLGHVGAGKRFVVITDPGTPLEDLRQQDVMRVAVKALATVGGRFSALSVFGIAPAALAGLDVQAVVDHALEMERRCHVPDESNPGCVLAAWMVDAFESGRDKLTLVSSKRYRAFGLWIEQLVAESTGKQGKGIVPVIEDASVPVQSYGSDRAMFVLREPDDAAIASYAEEARTEGIPVFESLLDSAGAIGAEFVRWTFAIALTGHLMSVNPFDEPNVAEAKQATVEVLEGTINVPRASADLGGIWPTAAGALSELPAPENLDDAIAPLIKPLSPGNYLAILAFLPDDEALFVPLRRAAYAVSATRGVPVCVEMGPRYLHSTGQLHKGGPDTGAFLMITNREQANLEIPNRPFSLAELFRAQAEGDLVTLAGLGRRIVRLDLPGDDTTALSAVTTALTRVAKGP